MAKNDFIVNGQMPAFPSNNVHQFSHTGLTKREYFAATAMHGLLYQYGTLQSSDYAKYAIKMADELLKQLEK